jgi:hypothetical protein
MTGEERSKLEQPMTSVERAFVDLLLLTLLISMSWFMLSGLVPH